MRTITKRLNTRLSPMRLISAAAVLLAGVLFARVDLMEGLRPLSGAWVLAAGAVISLEVPALMGVIIGTLTTGLPLADYRILLPAVLLAITGIVARKAARKISLGYGALLVAAAQLATLPFPILLIYDLLRFLSQTGLAVGAYTCMRKCLQGVLRRFKLDDTGELLSSAMCAAMLLGGLTKLQIAGFGVDRTIILTVCMLCAALGGAGAGAGCGMTAGLITLLSGSGDAAFAMMLGVGGLTGGALKPLGKPGVCTGFLCGALLMGMNAGILQWMALAEVAAAALCLLLLPKKLLNWLSGYVLPLSEERLREREARIDALRRSSVERVEGFSECLSELSKIFTRALGGTNDTMEDVAPLMEAVANEACVDCPRKVTCWREHFYETYNHFMTALSKPGPRKILLETDFPERFTRKCPNMGKVLSSLRASYGLYKMKSTYRKRIDESRQLVGKQLEGISGVMKELSMELEAHIRYNEDAAKTARAALEREGVPVIDLLVQERPGGLRLGLSVKACGGRKRCKNIERILSRALGTPLRLIPQRCGWDKCILEFAEAVPLQIRCRAYQLGRETGLCGDAVTHGDIEGRGYLLCLSDGMGTGARAAAEAQASVGLIEKLFRAGFSDTVIYDTVNQILLLRSAAESCCTLDLCLIDPLEAQADFIKVGAAPSYIVREGRASPVFAPALPMGMLEQINPCLIRRVLMDEDVIILLSDGIATGEDDPWLLDMLSSVAKQEPEKAARSIVELAQKRYGRKDDMTALVARVKRNKLKTAASPVSLWKARVKGIDVGLEKVGT